MTGEARLQDEVTRPRDEEARAENEEELLTIEKKLEERTNSRTKKIELKQRKGQESNPIDLDEDEAPIKTQPPENTPEKEADVASRLRPSQLSTPPSLSSDHLIQLTNPTPASSSANDLSPQVDELVATESGTAHDKQGYQDATVSSLFEPNRVSTTAPTRSDSNYVLARLEESSRQRAMLRNGDQTLQSPSKLLQ
ncbi:hypothetical protein H2200_011543 [Cladophialophora chaetospira]|uniref:Uncharacterized protein n=1 Tax=Cladophialophora chaetospira TaxID=386627 RepID=A0AA38WZI3_9EURO|nr:hypothetical protein H2200_011543 [Cladophialophora chaetospira]